MFYLFIIIENLFLQQTDATKRDERAVAYYNVFIYMLRENWKIRAMYTSPDAYWAM